MEKRPVSTQTIRRLPVYLGCLRARREEKVSATAVADALGLNEVQVRKDLAAISSGGRSGVGYETAALIGQIEHFLGYDRKMPAVLIGAGNLGRALLGYPGFARCGLKLLAAFDTDEALVGRAIDGVSVLPPDRLGEICRAGGAKIGIITVPERAAQAVCDQLVKCGVRAIWNFAPTHLRVPEGVLLQNENLAASLGVLSRRLAERCAG